MQQQEWRSLLYEGREKDRRRFRLAMLCVDVERWTIIPTIRPQSVAEHSFGVAMIADAFCEELGLGRGSAIRQDATRWALWHDVDEIFTGDIPTPMKMQVPKHVMVEAEKLSGANTHIEECGSSLALEIVKLADLVEACRFLNTWGVEPSKTEISTALKGRIQEKIESNINMGELALIAAQLIVAGETTWWCKSLKPPGTEQSGAEPQRRDIILAIKARSKGEIGIKRRSGRNRGKHGSKRTRGVNG